MCDGEFGGGRGIRVRCVQHRDTLFRRPGHVDVVDTDTGPAYYLQILCTIYYPGRDSYCTTYQHSMIFTDNVA